MAEERLLTISDLVELLQLSRSTVMVLLARGDIESLQIRRTRRVTGTALRKFIEARAAAQAGRATRGASGGRDRDGRGGGRCFGPTLRPNLARPRPGRVGPRSR